MQNLHRVRITRRAVVAASTTFAAGLHAQPSKTIRLIVSFAAGSGNDLTARDLARYLSGFLKQPVLVENKPGGGGSLGTDAVVRAAPDGLTLGLGTSSQLVMNVGLLKSLPFDVDKDLRTIGLVSRANMVLVGRSTGPRTLKALIAEAKARPNQLSYGSGGIGSTSHIVGEAFAKAADIKINHVPYKGNGPALSDLAGEHVDLVFDGLATSLPMSLLGQVNLLAVSGTQRNQAAPGLATFAEQGLRGYEAYTWNCLIAPAQTPLDVMARINRALSESLAIPEMHTRLVEKSGSEILAPSTPQEAEAFARRERERWVPFIRSLKLDTA
ncbi:MAG: tripartite tricarboxylate transporter substrate binding protein [Comamonadaceae bacterium]|nr:tripartite tricarboxylate transporter substrate binding protein [Comamonadaceae bacterium]